MDKDTLTAVVEAILLTASGPVTVSAVTEAIDDRKGGGVLAQMTLPLSEGSSNGTRNGSAGLRAL